MKTSYYLSVIFTFLILSCDTAKTGGAAGGGSSKGLRGSAYDTGTDGDTNADADGVTGDASTYGTGTGVSGQTPTGSGSGTGNTGRSGVGIKREVQIKKK